MFVTVALLGPTSQNLLHRQRRSVQDRKERYDNGLLKLADTEEQVAQMQVDLEELQPKLKEATIATDALLVQIAKDTEVANEKKAVVEKEASSKRVVIPPIVSAPRSKIVVCADCN